MERKRGVSSPKKASLTGRRRWALKSKATERRKGVGSRERDSDPAAIGPVLSQTRGESSAEQKKKREDYEMTFGIPMVGSLSRSTCSIFSVLYRGKFNRGGGGDGRGESKLIGSYSGIAKDPETGMNRPEAPISLA